MCNLASKGCENQPFFNGFSKEIKASKKALLVQALRGPSSPKKCHLFTAGIALQSAPLMAQHVIDENNRLRSCFYRHASGPVRFPLGPSREDSCHGGGPQ